jgi:thymidylate kinase
METLSRLSTLGFELSSRKNLTRRSPKIVTFSGIDGAGKTTQIERVSAYLLDHGYRVARASFWDDVAFLSKLRAGASLAAFRKQESPREGVVLRNDKNVFAWYLTLARSVLYLFDAFSLSRIVSRLRTGDVDFVIFDRYLYDQLAQIRSRRSIARAYTRLLIYLTPKPEFAFILDASPDEAFARKPEYPLDFLYSYRSAFLRLRAFVPQLVVVPPSSVEDTQREILNRLSEGSALPLCASPAGNL